MHSPRTIDFVNQWVRAAFIFGAITIAPAVLAADERQAEQNAPAAAKRQSDSQLKRRMIAESIAAYDGRCPCPYSTMSNGRQCGRRSAWSKPGGESPLCYESDVTAEMVEAYRSSQVGN
jgi:hypothetical protein